MSSVICKIGRKEGDSIDFFGSVTRVITGQDVLIWLAAAAVIGLFCLGMCMAGRMKKRTAVLVVLLGFYLAVIFTFTLGHRVPGRGYDYNLKLFWTIEAIRNGKKSLISECIWNVALFIPLGILLGLLFRGRCVLLPVLTGAAVSAVVELAQLVGKLGLFEFDDMIYNTAGCLIGVLVGSVITVLFKKKC